MRTYSCMGTSALLRDQVPVAFKEVIVVHEIPVRGVAYFVASVVV